MIEIPRKKSKHQYMIFFFIILIFCTTFFIMYKYHVEGEKKLPFNITKIILASSAKTEDLEIIENTYQANVIQKNDIYIAIEKNKEYSKEDAIKKITFNNFQVLEKGGKGTLEFYRTSSGEKSFEYIEKFKIKDSVEYIGSNVTNLKLENMIISNQGGLIELSAIIKELGKITYSENDNIITDGSLLNRLELKQEDIKHKISFDMIMELAGGNTFKTTIYLNLPSGDILTQGVCIDEKTDFSDLIFKRI